MIGLDSPNRDALARVDPPREERRPPRRPADAAPDDGPLPVVDMTRAVAGAGRSAIDVGRWHEAVDAHAPARAGDVDESVEGLAGLDEEEAGARLEHDGPVRCVVELDAEDVPVPLRHRLRAARPDGLPVEGLAIGDGAELLRRVEGNVGPDRELLPSDAEHAHERVLEDPHVALDDRDVGPRMEARHRERRVAEYLDGALLEAEVDTRSAVARFVRQLAPAAWAVEARPTPHADEGSGAARGREIEVGHLVEEDVVAGLAVSFEDARAGRDAGVGRVGREGRARVRTEARDVDARRRVAGLRSRARRERGEDDGDTREMHGAEGTGPCARVVARSRMRLAAVVGCVLLLGCRPKATSAVDAGEAGAVAASASASSSATVTEVPVAVDVATNASTAWDAGPSVVPAGEVDGSALRARHRARLAKDASAVAVLRSGTALELGQRLCEAKVPKRPKETPILIKPNLGGFEWFKDPAKSGGDDGVRGRITDPEFVRGILRCLAARGHTKVTVAEGWGATHADWERLAKVSGYEAMTREENVPLVAMDDDGVFDVEGDQPGKPLRVRGMEKTHAPTLLVPKILAEHLDHGLFISAPKIKAHRFGVVSIAIKGGQGTVMLSDASPAFRQKWRMHKELGPALALLPKDKVAGQKAYLDALDVFAERMTDVLEINAPDVVLAEGAPMMGGDGFGKRWPSEESVAVGGTNPILVDRVAAALLGLWKNEDLARELGGHDTSPLITTAAKRFGVALESPAVEGDGKALLEGPRPVHFVSMSGFAIHGQRASNALPSDGGAPDGRVARAVHVAEGAIAVDGTREGAWDAAPATSFATDWSGNPTTTASHVRFLWSERVLYMLWELEGAGLTVDTTRPVETERGKLYEEDCVELFLAPDPGERARYLEVEVGPLGHFFDIAIDRRQKPVKSDTAWSSRPTIKTTVDRAARKATIEVALRAPEITSALQKGARLPLGLYRMEGAGKRQYLAWSPTRTNRPDFHVPEAFGTLVLE